MSHTCHATFARNMLAATLVCFAMTGCFAAPKPESTLPQWKTECVGRYQISVPGDIEFALTANKALSSFDVLNPIRFGDGANAPYSKFIYDRSEVSVTKEISVTDFDQLRSDVSIWKQAIKSKYASTYRQEIADAIQPLGLDLPQTFAWQSAGAVVAYMYRGGRVYSVDSMKESNLPDTIRNIGDVARNFRPRPPYDLPAEPGVCIPYGFIADDGSGSRHIGVTMRLKDHPDVEIFFEDASTRPPELPALAKRTAKDAVEFFWRSDYANFAKTVKLGFPSYPSVHIAGREGASSFVEILRRDNPDDPYQDDGNDRNNAVDYGYMAYVKGDPGATEDTPNLTLYVIRTAGRAKNTPVTEEQLKDMAKQIAASIKRRPANVPQSASGN